MNHQAASIRIGIDLGGTKIEALALDTGNNVQAGPFRVQTPRDDYAATLSAIGGLVARISHDLGLTNSAEATVGAGIPGSISKSSGLVQNANSVWLNGRPLLTDLGRQLGRPVRIANDANCFALSEATDGAGAGYGSVFGVILGTGCGGGLVIGGRLIDGPLGIGGEWGHNPLPWLCADEFPGPVCWCGRNGCMETWVAGPALEAQYMAFSGSSLTAKDIALAAAGGDDRAAQVLQRHTDRLARGLAHVINILDPGVVVLGGGLSNLGHLYRDLPGAIAPHLFCDAPDITIRPPRWGDSGGVRGAAWLWND